MSKEIVKKPTKSSRKKQTEEFAPTKVSLAVATLASITLVVLALIATLS